MPELPTSFGKYFLTEKLATGGMAEIYLAKIVGPGGFEKQLVIKQIHPKLSGQRHFVDLFVAEAKTLVTLAHGNIVPVYELGVVDETYFIAMEYIDGPTLYRLTESVARKDARIEPALAAWITARILEGLDYAHRKGEGVIHRDLSPRNVMLSRDGEVKLVDFGIAVTLGNAGEDESAQSAPTGSFPYMSPEQVRKEQLTAQTDLFSVGVLLWEMLVGHRLFARNDPDATLLAVTDGEIVRPSSERPDIPAKLDDVVMRALERDKTLRWVDAAEMLAALQKYLYALDDTPGPRDVTALVAKFCPPETRRLPTHADTLLDLDVPAGESTTPRVHDTEATPPPPAPSGPATAVIPREGDRPRGKARAVTRQQSFATHVALEDMLERGTPLFGVPAVGGDDHAGEPTTTVAAPSKISGSSPVIESARPESPDSTMKIRARSVRDAVPTTVAPSRALLVVAGIGAIGLAIASVWVFLRGREAVLAPDAAPKLDAPFYMLADAAMDGTAAAAPDGPVATSSDSGIAVDGAAAVIDAIAIAVVDAGIVRDAEVSSRDAGPRPRADAGASPIDAKVTGTAKLVLGADPWGEIVIDGVKRGRTPQTIQVSAGHHVVEIIFPGVDPPKKETYTVDLADGGEKELIPDFTKL
jgi:serine/threonine protein kinase